MTNNHSCHNMDLLSACWMIRSLDQAVSTLSFDSHSNLVAGGWDGQIKKWNSEGDMIWVQNLPDRISEIIFYQEKVIVASGLHIVCLDSNFGDIEWQKPLEGSADSILVKGEQIFATSSVYDIEHNDFLESAIWAFDLLGKQIWVTKMNERPWFILSHEEDVIIGLGRPISGWAEVSNDGEITNHSLFTDSPVMCGVKSSNGILFGHADGTITSFEEVHNKFSNSIESISATDELVIVGLEGGNLVAYTDNENKIWAEQGSPITCQSIGFSIPNCTTHWSTRWSGVEGSLQVRNLSDGTIIAQTKISLARCLTSNESRVAIGAEDGNIHVWQNEMFARRLDSDSGGEDKQSNERKALKDRLRALRNK